MNADEIKDGQDLLTYIEDNLSRIYVREKICDVWQSISISQLPADLAIKHVFRFLREGKIPVIVKEKDHTTDWTPEIEFSKGK